MSNVITCYQIIWLRGLLTKMEFPHSNSTPFHADNTSVIQIVTNLVYHETTKHIEANCHSIREVLYERVITLLHVLSDLQIANIFTKSMALQCHFLIGNLLFIDPPESI